VKEKERRKAPAGIPVKGTEEGLAKAGVATGTPEMAELEKNLVAALSKFGLKDVALKVVRAIQENAEGSYEAKLIKIAFDAEKPIRTMRHEAIHALKELGFFTKDQWRVLESKAKNEWVQTYLAGKRAVVDGKEMSRLDAYKKLGLSESEILEEAIADAFADFDVNKAPPGMMMALLNKLRNFFKALRQALTGAGFESAEDIFGKIETGKLESQMDKADKAGSDLDKKQEKYALRSDRSNGSFAPDDKTISTRKPKSVKAPENYLTEKLNVGIGVVKEDPVLLKKHADLVRNDPMMGTFKSDSDEETLNYFIEALKDNLLHLWNSTPKKIRDRSRNWYKGANKIANNLADGADISERAASGVLAALSPQTPWDVNVSQAARVITIWKNHQNTVADSAMYDWFNSKIAILDKAEIPSDAMIALRDAVKDKPFGQTHPDIQAWWLRAYDETHHSREYHLVAPEGESAGLMFKKNGEPANMPWGNTGNIDKALSILNDDSMSNISEQMGDAHKVRSFYNNIVEPDSKDEHVTIDTHAIAAARIEPLSGSAPEVLQAWGGKGSSDVHGQGGLYGEYAEAYRRAAQELGALPREVQSVTWEKIRGFFPDTFKTEKATKHVKSIWEQYQQGKITAKQVREQITDYSPNENPNWHGLSKPSSGEAQSTPNEVEPTSGAVGSGQASEGKRRDKKLSLRKAPNTPEFKRWFGNSKVVDENGEPLVMYHGTTGDITTFIEKNGGIFLTPDSKFASRIALNDMLFDERTTSPTTQGANVLPVFVRSTNPFDYENSSHINKVAKTLDPRDRKRFKEGAEKGRWQDIEDFLDSIKEAGFDSAFLKEQGRKNLAVFSPNQIKSATGNTGTYDSANPDIRFSLRDALGLYSELENKIAAGSPKAPAASWKAYVNSLTTKGVKPEEIEWSGVNDWLDLQKGTVTKDALLAYLKEGGVKVEEIVLGEKGRAEAKVLAAQDIAESIQAGLGEFNDDAQSMLDRWRSSEEGSRLERQSAASLEEMLREAGDNRSIEDFIDAGAAQTDSTQYGQYTLTGGENYREVLLKLPEKEPDFSVDDFIDRMAEKYGRDAIYETTGNISRMKDAFPFMLSEKDQEEFKTVSANKKQTPQIYRSSHWDQPNVLAHIRLNDRIDEDGNKVLFVEELQSDWGQEGKKKGFKATAEKRVAKKANRKERYWEVLDQNGNFVTNILDQDFLAPPNEQYALYAANERLQGTNVSRTALDPRIVAAPFVTKTEGWLNLALKRIMVMAAEGGYDKVAFVNGDQSADRYDLSKQVTSIEYKRLRTGRYNVYYTSNQDDGRSALLGDAKESELEGAVGKDLAKKIIEGPQTATFSGLDLKVGGEGMKTFYDTIVPNTVKKLLPKVGGGQMQSVTIQQTSGFEGNARKAPAKAIKSAQPGFDVTPSMKEKVETTGLPRFSLRTVGEPPTKENVLAAMKIEQEKQSYMNCQLCVQMATGVPKLLDLPRVKKAQVGDVYTFNERKDMASHYAIDIGDGNIAEVEGWGEEVRTVTLQEVVDEYGKPDSILRPPDTAYTGKAIKPRFSLRDIKAEIESLPNGKQIFSTIKGTTTTREEKGWAERITSFVAPKSYSKFRSQALDHYDQLSVYERALAQANGGIERLADSNAHSAALMSDLHAGVTAQVLGVDDGVGGVPVYDKGYTTVSNLNGTVKGPIEIFKRLAAVGDPTIYQAYQFWAAAKRGKRLLGEGREQNIDANGIGFAQALEDKYPMFVDIQKDWVKFNNGLVKYQIDTGVISKEMGVEWMKYADYLPFYRQLDGENTAGPKIYQSISGVKPPKELQGSKAPLADFLETVVRNTHAAVQAGMKNVAAQRAGELAVQAGIGERLDGPATGHDIITALENGKQVFYRVGDDLFVDAVTSLNIPELPFLSFLTAPANMLRNLVTKDPGFMLANLMRDSISAYVTSGANMKPMIDTMQEFTRAVMNNSSEFEILKRAGVVGGYDYAKGVEASGQTLAKQLRKRTGTQTKTERRLKPVTGIWDFLEKGSEASDAATRITVFKDTLKRTGNEAEALLQSLEVMNFNRKGSSALIRIVTAGIPFLNARMQGLDIFYRAGIRPILRGSDPTEREKVVQRAFFVRGAMLMGISLMYAATVKDDPEYEAQEEETKDNNWLITDLGIRIPTPFEVGFLFKTVPERIYRWAFSGSDTGTEFAESMKRGLVSTFAFNPVPQTFLPVAEAITNYSTFTMRPIVGQNLLSIDPSYQVGPSTSVMAEALGKKLGVSPMKIDHIFKGYTGTMGMYLVDTMDTMFDLFSDNPRPAKRFEQMPILKRFLIDKDARGNVTAYYAFKHAVDEAVRTTNMLDKQGSEEAGDYQEKKAGLLNFKKYVSNLDKQMTKLQDEANMIRSSGMSAKEKRDALLEISQIQNELVSDIREIKKMAKET
jgi:hypothetical protein